MERLLGAPRSEVLKLRALIFPRLSSCPKEGFLFLQTPSEGPRPFGALSSPVRKASAANEAAWLRLVGAFLGRPGLTDVVVDLTNPPAKE